MIMPTTSEAGFNPHTHAGCDTVDGIVWYQYSVSIHTPTQGVTLEFLTVGDYGKVSIHTPTQGVTKAICKRNYL